MTEQGNLPTRRVNIYTQKMLGGIGYILILMGWMPRIGTFLSLVGTALWFISMYQLSNILGKPSIFRKVSIFLILGITSMVTAFAFAIMAGILAGISLSASVRGETGAILRLGLGAAITIIATYAIIVVSAYFYKEAYDILAQATTQNLFKIGGLLMFIGAITIILFGLGLLLIVVSNIVLAVAFFTAPKEVEVQGA
ncbi:MAG: DUF996 domain-containing protein [Thermocrinis sp.]|uniref:DUF996 domain-containing protein n=1 Tax=Thermocrinis sp. TaxID=2024383 RepID=UPI003C037699